MATCCCSILNSIYNFHCLFDSSSSFACLSIVSLSFSRSVTVDCCFSFSRVCSSERLWMDSESEDVILSIDDWIYWEICCRIEGSTDGPGIDDITGTAGIDTGTCTDTDDGCTGLLLLFWLVCPVSVSITPLTISSFLSVDASLLTNDVLLMFSLGLLAKLSTFLSRYSIRDS